MGPVSAALIATLAAVTVTALWLAHNERRVRIVVSAVRRAVLRTRAHLGDQLRLRGSARRFDVGGPAPLTVVG